VATLESRYTDVTLASIYILKLTATLSYTYTQRVSVNM